MVNLFYVLCELWCDTTDRTSFQLCTVNCIYLLTHHQCARQQISVLCRLQLLFPSYLMLLAHREISGVFPRFPFCRKLGSSLCFFAYACAWKNLGNSRHLFMPEYFSRGCTYDWLLSYIVCIYVTAQVTTDGIVSQCSHRFSTMSYCIVLKSEKSYVLVYPLIPTLTPTLLSYHQSYLHREK